MAGGEGLLQRQVVLYCCRRQMDTEQRDGFDFGIYFVRLSLLLPGFLGGEEFVRIKLTRAILPRVAGGTTVVAGQSAGGSSGAVSDVVVAPAVEAGLLSVPNSALDPAAARSRVPTPAMCGTQRCPLVGSLVVVGGIRGRHSQRSGGWYKFVVNIIGGEAQLTVIRLFPFHVLEHSSHSTTWTRQTRRAHTGGHTGKRGKKSTKSEF